VIKARFYQNPVQAAEGLRPINLRTDLAQLADLIEQVFADSMDSGGRSALREMRYLSRMGPGLRLLSSLNDLTLGINMGYVWIANGRLVGNVSIYPADWPRQLGSAWIVANVGVHPDYQGRGIARQLMNASLELIRQRGGQTAILQVDVDNHRARGLYRSLNFIEERAWTTWRRPGSLRPPEASTSANTFIRRRRRREWKDELALARRIRSQAQGGLGWLRPLHPDQFRHSLAQTLSNWINLRGVERLVIRSANDNRLLASLWIETGLASKTRLTLLIDPLFRGIYDDVLLNTAVRRFGRATLTIEHPGDDFVTSEVLEKYHFFPQRQVIHMRRELN
jgi:ribosomal protein S18 acetylase RimI-like enzyme